MLYGVSCVGIIIIEVHVEVEVEMEVEIVDRFGGHVDTLVDLASTTIRFWYLLYLMHEEGGRGRGLHAKTAPPGKGQRVGIPSCIGGG